MLNSLKMYTPWEKGNVAHVVRHYSDRNEVYVFCIRRLGKPVGTLYTMEEYDNLGYEPRPMCPKCQAAIEGSIERVAVLHGKHPSEVKVTA